MQHKDIATTERHAAHSYEYADSTARLAASGFVSGDVGKLALQLSDSTFWVLSATTPTWTAVGGAGSSYTHPANHPPSIITQDASNRFVTDSEKSTWNGKQAALVSGTNIKTINGTTILGSGDLTVAGGGGGTGDVVSNTSTSADSEIALFSGTAGKTIKRATGTGLAKVTAGVLGIAAAGTDYVAPDGALGTPVSGALDACTVDGQAIGYRHVPQNSQSAAYTLVLSDAAKHILHPSADTTARTITVPANSSVAYPVGTAITIVNQNGAGALTIAITTDTMRLAGVGTVGSRTLAANGLATLLKITSTEWIISGSGLT